MKPILQFLKPALFTLVAINAFSMSAYAQIQIGNDIDGEESLDRSGHSVSMPDANTLAIGSPKNSGNGMYAGQVRIFMWSGGLWTQKGLNIDGESAWDRSGYSVCMPDTNTVAIGSPYSNGIDPSTGLVRVYTWDGIQWNSKGFELLGDSIHDLCGYSVCMPDANTLAVGAPNNSSNGLYAGHVRVYTWNGSAWIQKGLDIKGKEAGVRSGFSVSMPDSNTVAIGAPNNDGNGQKFGHVRVYIWDSNTWTQKGGDINGKVAGDLSGYSVSMPDASTLAIGSPKQVWYGTGPEHVRVFSWTGSSWIQKGLDIDAEHEYDYAGCSVSMPDANTVAIGAYLDGGNGTSAGHVQVYTWNGNLWNQLGFDIDGEAIGDWSGWSVSMPDVNTVAIGAPLNTGNGTHSGHVRVYNLNTVGIIENSFTDKFNIYPNPTTGHLFIHFDAVQDDLNIALYSLDGKLLENSTTKNASTFSFVIKAPAGIYLMKISNNKQEATVRVVKE